jgi:hypothetical protein
MMTSSKSLSPKTSSMSSALLVGAIFGAGAGALICLATWLSPLAALDRPTLALIGVTISLPLGAMSARQSAGTQDSSAVAMRGLIAGLVLSATLSVFEPDLWLRAAVWICAAALIGAAATGVHRAAGVAASALWLALGGLPFFCHALPAFAETAQSWALGGCPWLGFSQDAFGGDPLRRPVLYLGQWSELADKPALGLLTAGTLWITGALTLAILLAAKSKPRKPTVSE